MTANFNNAALEKIITHFVGNKLQEEGFKLSKEETSVAADTLKFLLKYFLESFKAEEFYSFSHSVATEMNNVYALVDRIFKNEKSFVEQSQNIARLLYERSTHPKIKGGELNVTLFKNMLFDGKPIDAVGVFKTESKEPFLKMSDFTTRYQIKHEFGVDVKALEKGCIVFNTERKDGFRVLFIDNVSRSNGGAQYWKDEFLQLQPLADAFHHTKNFLSHTKSFVTDQLSDENEVSRADQIDLLNRSMDYFRSRDTFVKKEFEKEVLQEPRLIKSFKRYNDEAFVDNEEAAIYDRFEISSQAVKRQSKIFKSVLKLDKNFHIYIHGDRSLIEQGVEKDGRKFYKIYYNEEK